MKNDLLTKENPLLRRGRNTEDADDTDEHRWRMKKGRRMEKDVIAAKNPLLRGVGFSRGYVKEISLGNKKYYLHD